MDWFFGYVCIVGIVACLILLSIINAVDQDDGITAFRKDCRKKGMTDEETENHIGIRIAFAKLRRLASDVCLELGGDIDREKIDEIAGVIASGLLEAYDKETAELFLAWAKSCPDHEILYRDAMELRYQLHKSRAVTIDLHPNDKVDIEAAFRVRR